MADAGREAPRVAGLVASPSRPQQIAVRMMELLHSEQYTVAARAFAAKHAGFNPQQEIGAALDRFEELLRQAN